MAGSRLWHTFAFWLGHVNLAIGPARVRVGEGAPAWLDPRAWLTLDCGILLLFGWVMSTCRLVPLVCVWGRGGLGLAPPPPSMARSRLWHTFAFWLGHVNLVIGPARVRVGEGHSV